MWKKISPSISIRPDAAGVVSDYRGHRIEVNAVAGRLTPRCGSSKLTAEHAKRARLAMT